LANNKCANQKHPKKKRKIDTGEKREREKEREPMGVKDLRPKWKRHVVPVGLKSHADPTQHPTLSLSLSLSLRICCHFVTSLDQLSCCFGNAFVMMI
jgi:hypothetical protein